MANRKSSGSDLRQMVERQSYSLLLEWQPMIQDLLETGSLRFFVGGTLVNDPLALDRLEVEARYLLGEEVDKPVYMPASHEEEPVRTLIIQFVSRMKTAEDAFLQTLAEGVGASSLDKWTGVGGTVLALRETSRMAARMAFAAEAEAR